MLPLLPFPAIDPVAVELGPLVIRWYALSYIAGILLGWRYARWLAAREPRLVDPLKFDDFILWGTLGTVIGGRLGYVLFYFPSYYLANPAEILQVWKGGMSFHGGMLGVALAIVLFCRTNRIPAVAFGDLVAAAAPIGLFFGRIANFINGELWGRVTDVPWAMVFPHAGPEPRHPSQLYEAVLEGLVLFVLLFWLARWRNARHRPGLLIGAFLAGYGVARTCVTFLREPTAYAELGPYSVPFAQVYSVPMILAGLLIVIWAARRPPVV